MILRRWWLSAGALVACTQGAAPGVSEEQIRLAEAHSSRERLRAALDRLARWHREHRPTLAASLGPPQSKEAIAAALAPWACAFPDEIYGLYRWHDGTPYLDAETEEASFVWCHAFLSLKNAVRQSQELRAREPKGLTLFYFQEEDYFVRCSDRPHAASPIWHRLLEDPDPRLAFTSLTTMIETQAEWHQLGLAKSASSASDGAQIRELERRRAAVHRERNPGAAYPYFVP
jgi:hypothetical protein